MAALRPRLRVGIFSDAAPQPRWMVEALARAGAGDFAELTLAALKPRAEPSRVPLLWRAYRRADRALFGGAVHWGDRRDLLLLVPPERRLTLDDGGEWRCRVRAARLDVAFVVGDVDDALLDGLARHGTWRFCFGDDPSTCEALAALREVLESRTVVPSGILIHRPGTPDRIACRSFGRAIAFSVAKSREAVFAKTGEFLGRALRDLHAAGASWVERGTEPAAAASRASFPGTARLVRDIGTLGARVARRIAGKALEVEEWSIAYRFGADEAWERMVAGDGSLEGFARLDPPKGGFWADPFPLQREGRSYIFFEELLAGSRKGHISVVEVMRDGSVSAPAKVLERDYHLSYPFLVEEGGELFMIPETAANRTVEIYRCVEFPARWKLERVLLRDVACVDATLHREGDRWWMFVNAAARGGDLNDELNLYSSTTLLGDWKPHRRNPVKSDVRSSRPAGRLFRRGASLYRPGQIGVPLYGSGIALNRVTRLTPDEYAEEEDTRIVPAAGPVLGIHTLNRAGDLCVTDAFMRRARF